MSTPHHTAPRRPVYPTKEEINKWFLIRYYPNRTVRWRNELVGLDQIRKIIDNDSTYLSFLARIKKFQGGDAGDVLIVNLRRGASIHVVAK